MATTIEELQILLKCDATQAQATLESLQTAVDKTVKKMSKGGSAGGGKGQTWFEKTNEKLKKTFEEIGKASLGIKNGDVGAKENYAHYIEQAKKLKSELEKAGNAADKAFGVGKKGGAIGNAIENMSYLDKGAKKVSDRLNNMPDMDKYLAGAAPKDGAIGKAIENMSYLDKSAQKVSDRIKKMPKMDKYLAGEAPKEPTIEYRGGSQPVPYKGWQPVSVNDLNNGYAGEAQRRALEAIGEAAEQTKSKLQEINLDKLTNGTPYERLSEKLKMLGNSAQFIKDKMASIGDTGDPAALLTLQTRLDTIEKKAEKVAQEMAKIEDEAASNGSSETASNVEQTGNAAENAAPKVERYGKAVKNAGSSSGFFGRMSKAAHGIFSKFGGSFKKHEGFLSKFGKTLKRVIMRMMAMGLVRGVIRGFTQGLQMLAKASPAAAEQFGRFTAMTKAVKAALGSAALAVLNAFASVLYNVASAAVTAANAVARFFGALGGGKYFAVSMADGFDNLSDSMSGAGGAAKGMLADFDELNVIGQQGGGGGGGAMSIGNATVSEQDASSILADLIKNDEFEKAGEYINKKLGEISDKIAKWFTDLDKKKYGKKFAELLNGIFSDPTAFQKAGKAVGTGINTIVNTIYDFLTTFDAGKAARSLASGLNSLVQEINWAHIGEMFGEGVNDIFEYLYNFFTTFDFVGAAESLASSLNSLVQTIDWNQIGATILQAILGLIEFAGSFLLNVDWGSLIRGLFNIIVGFIEEICKNPRRLVKAIFNLIGGVANVIYGLIGGVISGILDILAKIFPGLEGWGDKVQKFFTFDTSLWEQAVDVVCDEIFGAEEAVSDMADTVNAKTSEMGGMFDGLRAQVDDYAKSVDGLSSSINKIPSSKTTKYTFKANVEATSTGSSTATVNKPNINISMAMASGGIAYGETLARIGEYPNAHTNPEVVAPLNKLQGILEKSNGGNKANSADVKRQNELLTEQNRLLRIIAQKEIKLSPSPELGQVVTKATALYGAV